MGEIGMGYFDDTPVGPQPKFTDDTDSRQKPPKPPKEQKKK